MIEFFLNAYKNASTTQIVLEFLAFVFGILSVWYAKKENIWVYPTGLIATIITTYLLYVAGYLGDMMVNGYFAIMSVYGWYKWARKENEAENVAISRTNAREKIIGIVLFFVTVLVVFGIYNFFDYEIKKLLVNIFLEKCVIDGKVMSLTDAVRVTILCLITCL